MKRRIMGWLVRLGVLAPFSPLAVTPLAPDWTPDDAMRWKQFLQTPSGQALWIRARARETALCVAACSGKHDPKLAGGFSFTLNWLEQLSNCESISAASAAQDATLADDQLAEGQPAQELSYV